MKPKDIALVATTAVATFALALVVFLPAPVDAKATPAALRVATPTLKLDQCTFALKTDRKAYQAGQSPTITIQASNPTDEGVERKLHLSMTAESPADGFSRMPIMPASFWSQECVIGLKPGQTKTVMVATKAKLPAGKSISVSMSHKKNKLVVPLVSRVRNVAPVKSASAAKRSPKPSANAG